MMNRFSKAFWAGLCNVSWGKEAYQRTLYGILNRSHSRSPGKEGDDVERFSKRVDGVCSSGDDDLGLYDSGQSKWRLELAWVSKAVEPVLKLCKWALPAVSSSVPPSSRTVSEMIATLQRSKIGIDGWSLSDMTIGLYLIYLHQASLALSDDICGERVYSENVVQDLIYYLELSKGCYKSNTSALSRTTMLRERHIVKFVCNSSFMRPGYYIAIDPRRKNVILGIRGTQTVYDLITDILSYGGEEVNSEGYLTHFGTTEAARWFLKNEICTLRMCLKNFEGFKLRLVGHSLGAATATLLAIMLRKKSTEELGFDPEIVSAIGFATPPCVSKELADNCTDFVTTVIMQDDIVPRLSAASLKKLRNEIVETDWRRLIERDDWKKVVGLFTNAKQVVAAVQDVTGKLADFARFGSSKTTCMTPLARDETTCSHPSPVVQDSPPTSINIQKGTIYPSIPEELFIPGTVYFLKRDNDPFGSSHSHQTIELFTLWKRHPRELFQKIVLSGNIISDHKCDSHYYALRDVMKDLQPESSETIF